MAIKLTIKNIFMKKAIIAISSSVLILFSCSEKNEKINLENEVDSLSYGIGVTIAKDIKNQLKKGEIDSLINNKAVVLGFSEYFDTTAIFTIQPEEAEAVVREYFNRKEQEERMKYLESFKDVKEAGIKFLEENKSKEGVMVLPNGVQYKILKNGWGETPKATDTVEVHYKGSFIDGKVFESSYESGQPVTFPVNGVIPGFSSALQNMKVGSKWILYIPQELAYGANVRPESGIPPFSTLIFELELKKIVRASKPKRSQNPANQLPVNTQTQEIQSTTPSETN